MIRHGDKVVLIANPAAGGASRAAIDKAAGLLRERALRVEVLMTRGPGDAEALAREAAAGRPSWVMACGGDGTVNEAINGLAGSGVPLALLPLGTTNVLAREAGIPLGVEAAVGAAVGREARAVSLGLIEAAGRRRYFCLMAGVGFDALAVHGLSNTLKRISGNAAYVASGLQGLLRWRPGLLDVLADGQRYACHSLIASNSRRYAGRYAIAPRASLEEPLLHVCLIEGGGRLDIARFALALLRGRHLGLKGVRMIKCSSLEIRGNAHIQIDGDYMGTTPAMIASAERALLLIH